MLKLSPLGGREGRGDFTSLAHNSLGARGVFDRIKCWDEGLINVILDKKSAELTIIARVEAQATYLINSY